MKRSSVVGVLALAVALLVGGYFTGKVGAQSWIAHGQRIAYVMRNLRPHGGDVRGFVCALEEWAIQALARFNVKGERRPGRIGVWVARGGGREDKIAAVGVRVRRGVSYHGLSLNVDPDLGHYAGIVPCGVAEHGITSLVDLGLPVAMAEVDAELQALYPTLFPAPDC